MKETRAIENRPKVLFAQLLEMKSQATGYSYFSGFIGNVRIVMFRDRDYEIDLAKPNVLDRWNLYVEEAPPKAKATTSKGARR